VLRRAGTQFARTASINEDAAMSSEHGNTNPKSPGSDKPNDRPERKRSDGAHIPPDDQHTPGQEGEHSGGGLRGA
jgi:hypothetical protein